MSRGRPFQPGNKYGRGRPPGSRNKRSLGQQLLNEYEEPVIRKTLSLALQGNEDLLAALLPYVVSRRKDSPVKTGPLRTSTIEELSQTLEAVFKKVSSGQLTLNEAGEIASLLEGRRRIMETQEMDLRLRTLESLLQIRGGPSGQ
jgi:hypothetical protein